MKIQRVLLIHKRSAYEVMSQGPRRRRFLRLRAKGDPTVGRIERSHREHAATMERVQKELAARRIRVWVRVREDLVRIRGVDLVITVGGDGTLLRAAHYVEDVPVLGVNSSPSFSVGLFCAATAENFRAVLGTFQQGRLPRVELARLEVQIEDRRIPERVLNEVLFAHGNPAGTSRYILQVGRRRENHKSAGVWISTAAGSTGSIRLAGGKVLPIRSRAMQFLVREPFTERRSRLVLTCGFVGPTDSIEISSKMPEGSVFIDGPRVKYPVGFGERVRVTVSDRPLLLVGFRKSLRSEKFPGSPACRG